MCVVRGDGGGRLCGGLISVPGSDSASLLGPTGEMLPACSTVGTSHTRQCSQQERAHGWPCAHTPDSLSRVQQLSTLLCTLAFQSTPTWLDMV